MSRPTNAISRAEEWGPAALMWRKAEASTAVEFAKNSTHEVRQIQCTCDGGGIDSP